MLTLSLLFTLLTNTHGSQPVKAVQDRPVVMAGYAIKKGIRQKRSREVEDIHNQKYISKPDRDKKTNRSHNSPLQKQSSKTDASDQELSNQMPGAENDKQHQDDDRKDRPDTSEVDRDHEKPDRPDRPDRPERPEKPDRSDRN